MVHRDISPLPKIPGLLPIDGSSVARGVGSISNAGGHWHKTNIGLLIIFVRCDGGPNE